MRRASNIRIIGLSLIIFSEFIIGIIGLALVLFLSSCASSRDPEVAQRQAIQASYDDSVAARAAIEEARRESLRAEQWEIAARQKDYWLLHERIAQGQAESYRARSNAAWERYRYLSENYQ